MSDISKSVVGSILSAILIAISFSLWNDYIYKRDELSGFWHVTIETTKSSNGNYIGLKTYYNFVAGQNGSSLRGTGEKISEDSVNGIIEYDTDKRTHLNFDGALTYRVFSSNTVDMIYKEEGRRRPSSSILNLVVESNDRLTGTFISTISKSSGKVVFTRANKI